MLPQTTTALQVDHLSRSFTSPDATVTAVADASITVTAGEFLALIGASGSGKSTLLHCCAGLDQPDSGAVAIAGTNISAMSANRRALFRSRHVGFVFQDYNLVSSITVKDNIALPARIAGRRIDTSTVTSTLSQIGLSHHAGRYPHELSGGERQRVAIARVMAMQPAIVFADEPTAALDINSATIVLDWLDQISQAGTAVVMVTHDLAAAARAHRVLAMHSGHIRAELDHPSRDDLIAALTNHPENPHA